MSNNSHIKAAVKDSLIETSIFFFTCLIFSVFPDNPKKFFLATSIFFLGMFIFNFIKKGAMR